MALPNLILAGVGRAGTTSLFWYLSQHPDVCASSVKETRYFLPLSEVDPARDESLAPIENYLGYFAHCDECQRVRLEATPHYFHGGDRLVRTLAATLPDVRIVLTLREPLDRLRSIYQLAQSMFSIPEAMTLDEFAAASQQTYERGEPQTAENRPFWTAVAGSMYADFLPSWIAGFGGERLRVTYFDDLRRDPRAFLAELLDWLELSRDTSDIRFTEENRSIAVRSVRLHRAAAWLNQPGLLRNRRRVKAPLRAIYFRLNSRPESPSLSNATHAQIEELFRASNEVTAAQLFAAGYSRLPPWLSKPGACEGPGE